MLVSQNKQTAAMLVSQTNPPGIDLYFYANVFLCFSLKSTEPDHLSENEGYLPPPLFGLFPNGQYIFVLHIFVHKKRQT